jgi:hypothetical protein
MYTWDGKGIPEIGVECLCCYDTIGPVYYNVKIVGHDDGKAVFRWLGGDVYGEYYSEFNFKDCDGNMKFIPLKSKRDEEINEMVNIVISNDGDDNVESLCGSIHDAGYRKQMPYSQFVSIIQCYFDQFAEWDDSSSFNEAKSLAAKLGYTPEEN